MRSDVEFDCSFESEKCKVLSPPPQKKKKNYQLVVSITSELGY